jgi:hypothetical protein
MLVRRDICSFSRKGAVPPDILVFRKNQQKLLDKLSGAAENPGW